MSSHALGLRTPDVELTWLSVEIKHRKKLPNWLEEAMIQAETNASDGKLPVVVLHEANRRHDNDLVMLRLSEFREWFGEIEADCVPGAK